VKFETILYEIKEKILTITLNRPEKLNAFTRLMMKELITAFEAGSNDDNVRVIIVTGAGRGFCAGADLQKGGANFNHEIKKAATNLDIKKPEEQTEEELEQIRDGGGLTTLAIYDCNKPVIGAINGAAVGVGATMTLPMDIRIASDEARFGFVFARRGLVPEAASSWFLPRVVGISKALEWTYSGKVFSAQEALEGGLVRSVHAPEDLLRVAREIAEEIINNTSPVSVSLTRHMLWKMLGASHPMEAHQVDSRAIYELGKGEDVKEGVNAFLEKRSSEFPNKVSKDMPKFFPWWTPKTFK
jgi:enoyl-CoA hydratase/carnithine racemase